VLKSLESGKSGDGGLVEMFLESYHLPVILAIVLAKIFCI
jgi:hypothetical protein